MLASETFGDPAAPPLVAVHGFTQTARCWGQAAAALAVGHHLRLVDAPGHGRSPSRELHCDLAQGALELVSTGGVATYLGYSMGGRLCLQAACDHPDAVRRLVLVSATAGLADPTERAARQRADEALATRLETIGVAAFLREWLAGPLFAGLPPSASQRQERLTNDPSGLAASLRLAGTGAQEPLWDRLAAVNVPVLLVAGERDAKFVALGRDLAQRLPNATLAIVAGAGHTVHLEAPDRFVDTVLPWLAAHPPDDDCPSTISTA